MIPPIVFALLNFGAMAVIPLGGARAPRWSRPAYWLLLLVAATVLALHVAQDAWQVDGQFLRGALLVSTCLDAAVLVPLSAQALLDRSSRSESAID